jgi:hypothetical protein
VAAFPQHARKIQPEATFHARDVTLTNDIVKAGLNYKFGWDGPVVAKYRSMFPLPSAKPSCAGARSVGHHTA